MNPICALFLVTLLASAPAMAEPLDKFQVDAGAGKNSSRGTTGCVSDARQSGMPRSRHETNSRGLSKVNTGGQGRGNAFKLVCNQG